MAWFAKTSLVFGALFFTAACNTMHGIGEDVESVGEEISEIAED